MPTVLLLRHGQASFGGADYDELSERGQRQSGLLTDEFARRRLNVTRIVSGSLHRQRDTAAPVAGLLGLEMTIDSRWNEYDMDDILAHHSRTAVRTTGAGDDQHQVSSAEFQDLLEQALGGWIGAGSATPAAESWPAFIDRTRSALADVAAGLPSGTVGLAFTSGGVIAALCAQAIGVGAQALIPLNRVMVNAGITKLVYGRRGATLVSFNEHTHLELADPPLVTYR